VVEGEPPDVSERDPAGFRRVVATRRCPPSTNDPKSHGGRWLAGVSIRPRIDSDQSTRAAPQTRLFAKLADDGVFHGLPITDESPGERPATLERRVRPSNEENTTGPNPDGVHRERWVLVARGHDAP
jgi:hypothetical protein